MPLADLHLAIQITIGLGDSHLHDFEIGGQQYGDPDTTDDVANQPRMTLIAVVKSGVTRFANNYDFGHNWEHEILIEQASPAGDPKSCRLAATASATAGPRIAAAHRAMSRSSPIRPTRSMRTGLSG